MTNKALLLPIVLLLCGCGAEPTNQTERASTASPCSSAGFPAETKLRQPVMPAPE
jgi:hypothetical protein